MSAARLQHCRRRPRRCLYPYLYPGIAPIASSLLPLSLLLP